MNWLRMRVESLEPASDFSSGFGQSLYISGTNPSICKMDQGIQMNISEKQ